MPAFLKSKWLLCPLALVISLLLLLRLWLFSTAEEATLMLLSVKAEGVDNLLCDALLEAFEADESLLLGGVMGNIKEASATPSRIPDGEGGYFFSSLYSDISLSLYLPLTEREGSYYAKGEYMAVGKTLVLLSEDFRLEGRLSAIFDPSLPK